MPVNVQSLLTPDVASRWEFALSEVGYVIKYDRVIVCSHCGEAHQRIFLETEWDEDEVEYPDRAIVLTIVQKDEKTGITLDHYEQGERQVRTTFQVRNLKEFLVKGPHPASEALRALRKVALQKDEKPQEDRSGVCLN